LAEEEIALTYAAQTATPTMVRFKDVDLTKLGTVLDCTTGEGLEKWNTFMNEPFAGTNRAAFWRQDEAKRGFVGEFLSRHSLNPDVIVAPHPPSFQVIVRTQSAADKLQTYLQAGTK
jgi:hypothetical protein